MITEVMIGKSKRRFVLDPSKSKGKGGEADIFDIGHGHVLKVFKTPDHPDYEGMPIEQKGARARIAEHQRKLPAFPHGLPPRVVVPVDLAYAQNGTIAGYTMPFLAGAETILRFSENGFRNGGVPDELVIKILADLRETVAQIHPNGMVIGDFNDLNVLVIGDKAYVIDADSTQFGTFLCRAFTERFVDPLLVREKTENEKAGGAAGSLMLAKPYNNLSDWYAFAVMLMQTLLCLAGGPYGGVYKPKLASNRIAHSARPLHRITVFHPEVRYPGPARHFSLLPDDLLEYFHQVFEKDERRAIESRLIENIHWTTCGTCGLLHARVVCPKCQVTMPQAVTTVSTGTVSGERAFRTEGNILFAVSQEGILRWLYHHNNEYHREDGGIVVTGQLNPLSRFRINGLKTIIATANDAMIFDPDRSAQRIGVDTFGSLPVFDANERHIFWVANGRITRSTDLGEGIYEAISDVLPQQTMLWAGSRFGFGFYRAGGISQCFIFSAEKRGINDSLTLRPFKGQLVDSTCIFGKDRIWFLVSNRFGGKTINSCYLIRIDGTVEAVAETEADDGSWLGTLRGKCAIGDFLLAATDDGIVRVKSLGNIVGVEKEFPDSARFVHTGRHLFVDKSGLMVVGSREIWRLTIR